MTRTDMHDATHTVDWSTVATGWQTYGHEVESLKTDLTARMLAAVSLSPGTSVLELGAGPGVLARQLSTAVGPTGRVLATDVADGMVLAARAATADLANVETACIDAAAIELPDASFDAVVFRMGLMLLPEPGRGLQEMRRVLKPGGRMAASTWAGIEHNPWLTNVGMTGMLSGVLAGPLPTDPGGPLSLGGAEQLAQLAREAGFQEVSVDAVPIEFRVADASAHLAHVTSLAPPLKSAYETTTDDKRGAWLAGLEQADEQFRTDDGLVIPGRALVLGATA